MTQRRKCRYTIVFPVLFKKQQKGHIRIALIMTFLLNNIRFSFL